MKRSLGGCPCPTDFIIYLGKLKATVTTKSVTRAQEDNGVARSSPQNDASTGGFLGSVQNLEPDSLF